MSKCDLKTFVANQSYVPIGDFGYVIQPGSDQIISKKAHVYKTGRARISFTYNIIGTSASLSVKFNVYRERYHSSNPPVSLTNGDQFLFSTVGPANEFNSSFNTIDTTVEPGEYIYYVKLTNTDLVNPASVDFGSFVISTGKKLHYYTNSIAQQYPLITDPPVATLSPGIVAPPAINSITFTIEAEVFKEGQVELNYSGNGLIYLTSNNDTSLTFDLQRDGTSIVNGPQKLLYLSAVTYPSSFTLEGVTSVGIIDENASKGLHTYTLTVTNVGATVIDLDFISFSATASKSEFKNYVKQDYPLITAPDAVPLPPLSRADIQVDATVHEAGQAEIKFTLNTILTSIGAAVIPNFYIVYSNLLFEIVRTNESGSESITGGLQNLIRLGPTLYPQNATVTYSPSFYFVDKDAPQGKNTYTLSLVNNSSTSSNNIDYYTFTVTS